MRARRSLRPLWCSAWLSLAAAGMCVLSPSTAQAQGRVARVGVGPFVGERAAVTRAMVQSVLTEHAGEIELAPATEVMAAANREGVAGAIDDNTARVLGRALRLDQVLVGEVERRGRSYRLRIRVLRGRDGSSAGSASWEFDRVEEIEALRSEIWSQLSTSFRAESSGRSSPNAPPSGGTRIDDGASAPPPRSAPSEPSTPSATPDETAPAAAPASALPSLGWLHFGVSGGIAGRSWRIPILGERTARGYQNALYGEMSVYAAALFARVTQNQLGFGFEVGARIPVGLASQGRDTEGKVVALSTTAYEVYLGPTIMFRSAGGGSMRLGIGLALHAFDLDTAKLAPEMRLAPVSYLGLRIAGEAVLPFVSRPDFEFGVLVGGEFRVVGIGAEMREAFGQNPDTTLALGALLGLAARLDRAAPGLGLRLTAEWMRYRTPFAGPGRIGSGSDSVDDYTRYQLAVTYSFGAERPRRAVSSSESAWAGSSGASTAPTEGGASEPPSTRSEGDPFGR